MSLDPKDTTNGPMREVVARWKAAFDGHRPDEMAALFTADALFQGFGPEVTAGRDAVRAYYEAVTEDRWADVGKIQGYRIGDDVAGGFADVVFRGAEGWTAPVHLSLVLRREGDGWLIRAYHVSRIVTDH
ncbi:SgcJ/EcaC family oxidoreductase [Actinacidiphila glaucinigra]|uniref:YybH family protein n=1 Tax=Actinacidiphila glaucinigra TaxID=235986 RepID=UPI002DDBA6E3|nr:SgcJ/EcaC family oxidoreductase [Actinacidiphila glaucinigra]WSD63441.1 SgcJ/EcaC family oxidoreductase [Actinacidiphila glaucinigra]